MNLTNVILQAKQALLLSGKIVDYAFGSYQSNSLFCVSFETNNWGDRLNKYLLDKITGKNTHIIHINHLDYINKIASFFPDKPIFTAIGSVMHFVPDGAFVWGTGCIYNSKNFNFNPSAILSVRGPLTAEVISSKGFSKPELYGDPALVLQKYIDKNVFYRKKEFKIGVIPHQNEKHLLAVTELIKKHELYFIDIEGEIDAVIDDVARCDYVFSSSLHGLILSDILDIPNTWVRFFEHFPGENFKFNDYYSSLKGNVSDDRKPIYITLDNINNALIDKLLLKASVHTHTLNIDNIESVLLEHLSTLSV